MSSQFYFFCGRDVVIGEALWPVCDCERNCTDSSEAASFISSFVSG